MGITVSDSGFNTQSAITEWAAAVRTSDGWVLVSEPTTDRDAAEDAVRATENAVLISHEVTDWQTVPELLPPTLRASGATISRLVDEEEQAIRKALERGANIAVSKPDKPAERVLHRIGCPSLVNVLNREKAWTSWFREKVLTNPDTRPPMPDFRTRDDAEASLAGTRQCSTCEPELHGATRSIRSVRADGLGERHLGLTLSTDRGTPLGVIADIRTHTSANEQQRWGAGHVTITTDRGTHDHAGSDRVHLLGTVSPANIEGREQALRSRLGVE
ncbi:hypothetical protein ACWGJ9_10335 [Curtobacterium citreum]